MEDLFMSAAALMKKSKSFYLGIVIVLLLGIVFIAVAKIKPLKEVCIRDFCIQTELAVTDKSKQKGLMFRKSMPENQGMLFVFKKEAPLSFWMKNMRFPLDMIWMDSQRKVVDIYEYALPCKDVCKTITPQADAQFVLEVNAGFAKQYGIKIGDILSF